MEWFLYFQQGQKNHRHPKRKIFTITLEQQMPCSDWLALRSNLAANGGSSANQRSVWQWLVTVCLLMVENSCDTVSWLAIYSQYSLTFQTLRTYLLNYNIWIKLTGQIVIRKTWKAFQQKIWTFHQFLTQQLCFYQPPTAPQQLLNNQILWGYSSIYTHWP